MLKLSVKVNMFCPCHNMMLVIVLFILGMGVTGVTSSSCDNGSYFTFIFSNYTYSRVVGITMSSFTFS